MGDDKQMTIILKNKPAHQIHTVPRAGHETDVADGIERAQLVEREALVHKVDRHKVHGAKSAVYAAHELVHGRSQVLVFFHVLPRRHGELNEDDLGFFFRKALYVARGVILTLPIHSGC